MGGQLNFKDFKDFIKFNWGGGWAGGGGLEASGPQLNFIISLKSLKSLKFNWAANSILRILKKFKGI